MKIEISNHPIFTAVKRKFNFLPLTIDYDISQAVWPFQIEHFDEEGLPYDAYCPSVPGAFTINNSRNVDPKTGTKVPVGEKGMPEFDFLINMLKAAGMEPLTLGKMRVAISDQRGVLNDYKNLMKL